MSSWWRQNLYLLRDVAATLLKHERLLIPVERLRKVNAWIWLGLLWSLLLLWHWQLVLATTAGMAAIMLAYMAQTRDWSDWQLRSQAFWQSPHRPLMLAAGTGGLAALGVYMAAVIWSDSEQRWLATGAILQGIGTLATLGLLIYQLFQRQWQGASARWDRLILSLTHSNPLRRLVAVRQLTQQQQSLTPQQQQELAEYLHLMWIEEAHPQVRSAILETGLLSLKDKRALQATQRKPLQISRQPLTLSRQPSPISEVGSNGD